MFAPATSYRFALIKKSFITLMVFVAGIVIFMYPYGYLMKFVCHLYLIIYFLLLFSGFHCQVFRNEEICVGTRYAIFHKEVCCLCDINGVYLFLPQVWTLSAISDLGHCTGSAT